MKPTPVRPLPRAYAPPRPARPIDLKLDSNEGAPPSEELLRELEHVDVASLTRYPSAKAFGAELATRFGVAPEQIIVTAGADESIDRLCRATLDPSRNIVSAVPTFVMIAHYATLTGCEQRHVPWLQGGFPTEAVLEQVDEHTGLITVVSPNNPTGLTADLSDLRALSEGAPHAVILLDHAYVEFADEDLTREALTLPNVVVTRTFSKAWGLAGLRVGFAIGPAEIIGWLRATAGPFPVAATSLLLAERWLELGAEDVERGRIQVRREREALTRTLDELHAEPLPSQANFVFLRHPRSLWLWQGLAGLGIAVRRFPGKAHLEDALRITCPASPDDLQRLLHALRATLAPEAILFDMDGVLVDVSRSYRQAIIETARHFGVAVTADDVRAMKTRGDANNDWLLTQRLLAARGQTVSIERVTEVFERVYQGTEEAPGLRATEQPLVDRDLLMTLANHATLGVVTGRPRKDARRFLEEAGFDDLFEAVVCMEDAPAKPSPEPVRLALQRLGADTAWLIGDTPDDIRAARRADVVPIGVLAPGDRLPDTVDSLHRAGASRVLDATLHLLELLP